MTAAAAAATVPAAAPYYNRLGQLVRRINGIEIPEAIDRDDVAAIDAVLPAPMVNDLLDWVAVREGQYQPSGTSTGDETWRHSVVMYDFPPWQSIFREKVRDVAPDVMRWLGMPVADIADVEVQLTAHRGGGFFKKHSDNGSADTANRYLTWVYYFHEVPKKFGGGAIRFGDNIMEPVRNRIIFFPSSQNHEVEPVKLAPHAPFRHCRWTVNGWVRRPW